MDYKNSKWAEEIINLQHDNGSWGNNFHSLSLPSKKQPITTEQALRRLKILGYTIDDKPIKKAVKYIENCINGKIDIPEKPEKLHNWKIFTELMFSTWLKIFFVDNKKVNENIKNWALIINTSFENGLYNNKKYIQSYEKTFGIKPKGGRFIDFVTFYQISLLANSLDKAIEPIFYEYILKHNCGIYYIYGKNIITLPKIFESKETNGYISAIELLSDYKNEKCISQLGFVVKWINKNMLEENKWDIGKESKDGINFPLSHSWKNKEDRIKDCTYRINKLLEKLT